MKHYINEVTEEIFAYESDGSQDAFIKDGLIPISDADLAILRAPTPADLQATLNQKHRAYLASTDYFAIREYEGGKPMPNSIKELRAAARLEIKP